MSAPLAAPIDAATRFCAVYGHPIRHSASPAMHNAAFAARGLNWRYLACPVHPDHLQEAIRGAMRMGFLGLNLTVPHKLLGVQMVDALDDTARAWGAVNTIRFEARDQTGTWRPLHELDDTASLEIRAHGFNTDADAITRSLREDLGLEPAGATVLLLGAGGAGRTTALKLATEKVARLFLVNRTASKAAAVAAEIQARFPDVRVTTGYPGPGETADLILNATSLGLQPGDVCPLDGQAFAPGRAGAVYDMIYRPAETPLLAMAGAAGCKTSNGLGMLLYQGARAWELWTGQKAPIEVMRGALEKNIYEH